MSPSNSISSVITNNSPSPSGQLNVHSNCSSLINVWLRSLSRVIRKKWFLALILSMSAIYCIISFTPSINRRRESLSTFHMNKYMGARVHSSNHFIVEQNVDETDQPANSKLSFDHISSHELLAIPPENSRVNSLEELNSGQDSLTTISTATAASIRMSPIVFGSKIRIKSKASQSGEGENKIKRCRNSVQGRLLLADDQGYVCHRQFLTKGGCCNSSISPSVNLFSQIPSQSSTFQSQAVGSNQITRFSCNTCNSNGCCAIYEYCISCCMNPEPSNVHLQQQQTTIDEDTHPVSSDPPQSSPSVSDGPPETDNLVESHDDAFEFCLAKCRTSSSSVKHENSYRDARFKHCHGRVVASDNLGRKKG